MDGRREGRVASDPPAATPPTATRRSRADGTRLLLMRTAERLYAERGIAEVSNRQVAEAAGQANNSAVAYHIGTKGDLIVAIGRHHAEDVARRMTERVAAARGASDVRDHVACLVRPYTDHLASLGEPTWFARFTAQTTADPALGLRPLAGPLLDPLMATALGAVRAASPTLPEEVVALRGQIVRLMVVHTCAEQEQAAAAGAGSALPWSLIGDTLVGAATAVFTAAPG